MAVPVAAAVLVAVVEQELQLEQEKSVAVVTVVLAVPRASVALAAMDSQGNRLRYTSKVELDWCSMTMHSTCRLSL